MKYPIGHTPADEAAAQYIAAVGRMRVRQYEALAWGWFDHWRDLCQAEDALVRRADEEVLREVPITDD